MGLDVSSLPRCDWRSAACDAVATEALSARFGLPRPAAALLAARGLADPDAAAAFLSPTLQGLGDPLSLPGVAEAAGRVLAVLGAGGEVVVYGDFDADGVVATALLSGVICALGGRVRPFLPERQREGYGLSAAAIARCLGDGVPALLVTVDCGMGAAAEVAALRAAGVEVIVTDHHALAGPLPDGCLVVNPRLPGTPPGMEPLCGAGVAFKLAHALVKLARRGEPPAGLDIDLRDWLDAVALATVADVVPLRGENRILVAAGLSRLSRQPRVGLRALMQRAGLSGAVTSHHLGFVLGPRINAAGRMESAWPALELLGLADADAAVACAVRLEQLNALRRQTEQVLLEQAQAQIGGWFDPARHGAVVAGGLDWHPGTLGIVAARLSEKHQRPAAVVTLDAAGGGRGSVRAGHAYDAMAALAACADTLTRYGGHARAGGFGLRPGAFAAFREAFADACQGQVGAPACRPVLTVDAWLEVEDVDFALWQAIQRLEPYGEGHPRPRWGLRGLRLAAPPRAVGQEGDHLRLVWTRDGCLLPGVWFRAGAWLPALQAHAGAFDVVFELQENRFGGDGTLDLQIVDLAPVAAQ